VVADKRFAEQVLKRASGMIAVSENTRQDAIRILDLDPSKVVTIHSGIPDPFFDVTAQMGSDAAARYNLMKPYILAVGTVEPRKNLDTLLDAYLLLPREIREAHDLVLVGPMGWAASSTSRRIRSGLPGVKYLGYVPEAELPALTKAAAVFAYPSLYEGFGFPVAQAMACGIPVVTSCTSCLPEISGEGALHVDPKSPGEISRALHHLLESKELQLSLGRKGRDVAERRYRWDLCAEKSWKFFAQAAG
jgi:glycosyltransferase involved in cell wall biosynthesis